MSTHPLQLQPIEVSHYEDTDELPLELQIALKPDHPQAALVNNVKYCKPGKMANHKPLVSEGFGTCVALLVKDPESKEVALFHKAGHYALNSGHPDGDKELLDRLVRPGGHPIGVVIKGDHAYPDCEEKIETSIRQYFPDMQLYILHLDQSKDGYWNLAYRPHTDELLIQLEGSKEVRTFKLFTAIQQQTLGKYAMAKSDGPFHNV